MRFTTICFPNDDIVLGILGITDADFEEMGLGADCEAIDLRRNFQFGRPVPNVLKVLRVKDDADYDARMRGAGIDPNAVREVPDDGGLG